MTATFSTASQHTKATLDIKSLWAAYWDSGRCQPARNALIEHYLPIVRFTALRLAANQNRQGRRADIDDLLQFGTLGLCDAIRNFDASRGFKFETYCLQRVRGAMLDGLKADQWVPRDLRQRIRRFQEAREQTMGGVGSGPQHEAIAARLGVMSDCVHELEEHAARMCVGSLQVSEDHWAGEETAIGDRLADHREEEPGDVVQRRDVRDLFLRELTPTQRHLLALYYYDNLTMREIGEVLGISGTRVSQIHTEIMDHLRSRLAERMTDASGRARPDSEI